MKKRSQCVIVTIMNVDSDDKLGMAVGQPAVFWLVTSKYVSDFHCRALLELPEELGRILIFTTLMTQQTQTQKLSITE